MSKIYEELQGMLKKIDEIEKEEIKLLQSLIYEDRSLFYKYMEMRKEHIKLHKECYINLIVLSCLADHFENKQTNHQKE